MVKIRFWKALVDFGVLLVASQFHGVEVERADSRYWKGGIEIQKDLSRNHANFSTRAYLLLLKQQR
jgi:hypothetical protein